MVKFLNVDRDVVAVGIDLKLYSIFVGCCSFTCLGIDNGISLFWNTRALATIEIKL